MSDMSQKIKGTKGMKTKAKHKTNSMKIEGNISNEE